MTCCSHCRSTTHVKEKNVNDTERMDSNDEMKGEPVRRSWKYSVGVMSAFHGSSEPMPSRYRMK